MWYPVVNRRCTLVFLLLVALQLASRAQATDDSLHQFSDPAMLEISEGKSKVAIYEAEKASFHLATIRKKHSGYSGSGYVDYNGRGSFIEWEIKARKTDHYEVSIRYSSVNARPAEVFLDGKSVGEFDFHSTRRWDNWDTESLILYLEKDSHTIKVKATESAGPNIDWLSVERTNDTARKPTKTPTMHPVPTTKPTKRPTKPPATPSPSVNPSMMPTREPRRKDILPPTGMPTVTPTLKPTDILPPSGMPTVTPTLKPTIEPTATVQAEIALVLGANEFLSRREWKFSPSGEFRVGLNRNGEFIMINNRHRTIWSAGITGAFRCFMQTDGNLIVRDADHKALWSSNTSKNDGAEFVISNAGQVLIINPDTVLWMNGIPKGRYTGPSSPDLSFPIRGIFYYPWFPETWTVNGKYAKFEPDLGFYSSGDRQVVKAHIDAMDYAHVDLSIASWWGPETNLDRSRMTLLMDETIGMKSKIKWTVYYETERHVDDPPEVIREDLDYLKKWFAWHPAWAHIEGKPVIFIWNEGGEGGCDVADRWKEASNGEWYVVLKVFKDFRDCSNQPDSWHQYGPGHEINRVTNVSFSISPGFWRADMEEHILPRVSEEQFCANVKQMVSNGDPWQLITTFNEAGEGTNIEASPHWSSDTIYGFYLDCLHLNH